MSFLLGAILSLSHNANLQITKEITSNNICFQITAFSYFSCGAGHNHEVLALFHQTTDVFPVLGCPLQCMGHVPLGSVRSVPGRCYEVLCMQ